MRHQTPEYWPTRIMLAVGIIGTAAVGFFVSLSLQTRLSCDRVSSFGLPQVLIWMIALLVALVGLVWIVRIFRGPRDEPPRWRYRDR